jgi:hypothetical protein
VHSTAMNSMFRGPITLVASHQFQFRCIAFFVSAGTEREACVLCPGSEVFMLWRRVGCNAPLTIIVHVSNLAPLTISYRAGLHTETFLLLLL